MENQWLHDFETAVSCLLSRWYGIETLYVAQERFFNLHPSMRDAMWTIAHFYSGQSNLFDADQAAAIWFHECVLPILKGDKENEHEG